MCLRRRASGHMPEAKRRRRALCSAGHLLGRLSGKRWTCDADMVTVVALSSSPTVGVGVRLVAMLWCQVLVCFGSRSGGMCAMCLRRCALLATCPRRSVGAVRRALLATCPRLSLGSASA